MPKPPEVEVGHLNFDPPITYGSDRYHRTWELLTEMGLRREVVFRYKGRMELHSLTFPTKEQAMLFRLSL